MMAFLARYEADGTIAGLSIAGGGHFPGDVAWDRALLAAADPRFLVLDGDRITLTVAQGTATYRVIDHDVPHDTLLTVLESIVRPDGTRSYAVDVHGGAPDA